MLRATNLLVMLNRIAGRNPDSIGKIEEFLARDPEVTAPLAIEVAIEEGDPMGRALARILLTNIDPALAERLEARLPAETTALREAAVIIAAQLAIAADNNPNLPLSSIASAKIRFANRLRQVGETERAATELKRTVDSLEQAFESNPELAMHLSLAQSLLARALSKLGRREDALEAARRACAICESLTAKKNSEKKTLALSENFDCLSHTLFDVGLFREAVVAARSALQLHEAVAEIDCSQLPGLARRSLSLAVTLIGVNQFTEARTLAQKATDILGDWYEQSPDTATILYAQSLCVMSAILAEYGELADAVVLVNRAVQLLGPAAGEHPQALLDEAYRAFRWAAIVLRKHGLTEDALAIAKDDVNRLRELRNTNTGVYEPDLALSLNTLASLTWDAGDREAGLELVRESLGLHRQLVRQCPERFLPLMAMCLDKMSFMLGELHRFPEALSYARRLLAVRQVLFSNDNEASLPGLASANALLSQHLQSMGLLRESLEVARRAAMHYMELCSKDLQRFSGQLAAVLRRIAVLYLSNRDTESAISTLNHCCGLLKSLIAVNPHRSRMDCAVTLGLYSSILFAAGNTAESLLQLESGVSLLREECELFPHSPKVLSLLQFAMRELALRHIQNGNAAEAAVVQHELQHLSGSPMAAGSSKANAE